MPMPSYQIYCYTKGCKHPAVYKIAAEWSDGVVKELKTYGLCCEECLPAWLQRGRERRQLRQGSRGLRLLRGALRLLGRGLGVRHPCDRLPPLSPTHG